jgi:hypothetical protein
LLSGNLATQLAKHAIVAEFLSVLCEFFPMGWLNRFLNDIFGDVYSLKDV